MPTGSGGDVWGDEEDDDNRVIRGSGNSLHEEEPNESEAHKGRGNITASEIRAGQQQASSNRFA